MADSKTASNAPAAGPRPSPRAQAQSTDYQPGLVSVIIPPPPSNRGIRTSRCQHVFHHDDGNDVCEDDMGMDLHAMGYSMSQHTTGILV